MLKLGSIADDQPAKVTPELPAGEHRDLAAYADIINREAEQPASDPVHLIAPMLGRFIAADRGFARRGERRKIPSP